MIISCVSLQEINTLHSPVGGFQELLFRQGHRKHHYRVMTVFLLRCWVTGGGLCDFYILCRRKDTFSHDENVYCSITRKMSKPKGATCRLKYIFPFHSQIFIKKYNIKGELASLRNLSGFRTKAIMNTFWWLEEKWESSKWCKFGNQLKGHWLCPFFIV